MTRRPRFPTVLVPAERAQWQLPPGVPPGVWQYVRSPEIAQQYDGYFADNRLFEFDQQVLARYLRRPGLVVDLGVGTGRALLPLACRGFRTLGVDLSRPMLDVLGEKAQVAGVRVWRLQANLVELGCLRDQTADYVLCLFSTLGMIQGAANRRQVLRHVARILKPGGLLILHAHNVWYNLFDAAGRAWLVRHLWQCWGRRSMELGDKFFHYRGIPRMFVHAFTRGELRRTLRAAGLQLVELIGLDARRQRPLRRQWLLGGVRPNGWMAVCRRPAE